MIGDFHFIRPAALLLLLPLSVIVWLLHRRGDAEAGWRKIVAPHLLPFLLSGRTERTSKGPLWLIAITSLVVVLAIAGPTWRREPSPFADETSPIAIIIKVTPSMITEDVQPSRLECATRKIHDLLALRRGAKAALIAYAGTAHRVMPLTSDGGIIDSFASALDPKIMPEDGDAAAQALQIAEQTLAGTGSIVWFADSIAPNAGLDAWRKKSALVVRLLPPLLPGTELDALRETARAVNAEVIPLSGDDSDVASVARGAKFAAVRSTESSDRWQESGYWCTPLIAALLLIFFRKGWMVPAAAQRS